MSYQLEFSIVEGRVEVTVTGVFSPTSMFELIDAVKDECDRLISHQALVDCSEISGSMTEADRFAGGTRVAEVFGSDIMVALVMPVGGVTKLGQITAVNRGAKFFVSESRNEALEWLESN